MTWQQASYDEIKADIRPGDVIAFAGKDGVSDWIKAATKGPVSHVGIVLRSSHAAESAPAAPACPQIIESDAQPGVHYGVRPRWLDERMASYSGSIWWLPLEEAIRSRLDVDKFTAFLEDKEDITFDIPQAIRSAADSLDGVPLVGELTHNREEFSAFFCSELVAAGLEAGGAISSLDCSEVTPLDMVRFAIYAGTYYQIKGPKTLIPGYNTFNPEGWGE
jgi:hypothetical protein